MAECDVCGAEMKSGRSCALAELVVADKRWKRVAYGAETRLAGTVAKARCGDCGVATGGVHHPGCAVEQCPVCGEQLFCCDCEKEEPGRIAHAR